MNDGYIAVMDSGVGGLSVLKTLMEELPNESFIYFGDNKNAPYGSKTEYELLSLSLKNISYLKTFNIKALVIACNTLSVTLFDKLRYYAEVPCFGIFPPVEKALLNGENTLLLATPKTAERYKGKGVSVLGLPNLVGDIESNLYCLNKVNIKKHINNVYSQFDTVILGCTHYNFVKIGIFDHFRPKKIIGGEINTARMLQKELKYLKSSVKFKENRVLFVGKNSILNKNFWEKVVKHMTF